MSKFLFKLLYTYQLDIVFKGGFNSISTFKPKVRNRGTNISHRYFFQNRTKMKTPFEVRAPLFYLILPSSFSCIHKDNQQLPSNLVLLFAKFIWKMQNKVIHFVGGQEVLWQEIQLSNLYNLRMNEFVTFTICE